MARRGRLHVAHATYFVVIRFRPDVCILAPPPGRTCSDAELRLVHAARDAFESQLVQAMQQWCATVHAHCWLPDSALLLIEITHTPLDHIMRRFLGQFSRHLHRRTGVAGTPYAGRYEARVIDADEFLLDFARHIFLSPVRAGLCGKPQEYPYSSVHAWNKGTPPRFLARSIVFQAITARCGPAPSGLGRFLEERPTPGFIALQAHGSLRDSRIAGRAYFVREIHDRLRHARTLASTARVMDWARNLLRAEMADRSPPRRISAELLARALAAWLSTRGNLATLTQAARGFRVAPSTLHSEIRRYSEAFPTIFSFRTLTMFLDDVDSGRLDAPADVDTRE